MALDILTTVTRKSDIPPLVDDFIVMLRQPGDEFLLVILPNQDSYELTVEQVTMYLKLLKVPLGVGFLEYVWNFYGGKLDLTIMELEPMSLDQALSFMRQNEEAAF